MMPSDFAPNNVWGTTPAGPVTEELTLPSGQRCLAQKVRIEDMISTGIMGEVDSLSAIVQQYTRTVKGAKGRADGTEIMDAQLLSDPRAIATMVGVTDRVLPSVVVSPPVALHFKMHTVGKTTVQKALTDEEKDEIRLKTPGVIFTDQIGLEDKFHLFEWGLGGLTAFESFRDATGGPVGSVGAVQGPKKSPKRRPRSN